MLNQTMLNEITALPETVANATEVILKRAENSTKIASLLGVIRGIAEQQSQVSEDVSKNLTILSDHTRGNHQSSQNNEEMANSTMELATTLSDSLTRFKLD